MAHQRTTTLKVPAALRDRLKKFKVHPRETFAEVIERLLTEKEKAIS